MSYLSVDRLQKALADSIFSGRQDVKKAAGRALGTIVELITFYILREWGLATTLSIESALPEFGNADIKHNVEFGVHPLLGSCLVEVDKTALPITVRKILAHASVSAGTPKGNTLMSTDGVLRNACVLSDDDDQIVTANIVGESESSYLIDVSRLRQQPFAMVECKRVGVEDGAKKGPTTIEKAKQGAYVAKHVSSLQKIRDFSGQVVGAFAKPDGTIELSPWADTLKRLVYKGRAQDLEGFILTIGMVSNHGNWFTSNDPNKELRVLKQSYDWLLFLNDIGISEFVSETILSSARNLAPVRAAFEASYAQNRRGSTRFTKVKISYDAHLVLCDYFRERLSHIESVWLTVLSPGEEPVVTLKDELGILRDKRW